MLAAILGSLTGAAGTIAAMVIGSLASGTCSWWAERGIRRSAALAAARAEAIRARGNGRPRRRWSGPTALIAAAFIGCAIVVSLLEGAAGKPLSAVVQGKPGHGTTLGGGAAARPLGQPVTHAADRPARNGPLQQPARQTR